MVAPVDTSMCNHGVFIFSVTAEQNRKSNRNVIPPTWSSCYSDPLCQPYLGEHPICLSYVFIPIYIYIGSFFLFSKQVTSSGIKKMKQ